MSDRTRCWQAIDNQANTCHREVYMLYHDLALDDGDEWLAKAFLWMADQGKWPMRNTRRRYSWSVEGARMSAHQLPTRVIDRLELDGYEFTKFLTPSKAIRAAALCIARWLRLDVPQEQQ